MRAPTTWTELEQLLGEPERSNLDFKRELAVSGKDKTRANGNLASDIAAMSVDGGVILIGVEEDENSCACDFPGIELAGFSERVSQICGTRISPPLFPHVFLIPKPDDEAHGVVAITIEPSRMAPHYTGERFLTRNGTTTASLTEPQIERLYDLRRSRRALEPAGLQSGWPDPMPFADDESTSNDRYLCVSIAVAPLEPAVHPEDPVLLRSLQAAHRNALADVANRDVGDAMLRLRLDQWEPHDVIGWRSSALTTTTPARSAIYRYADGAVRLQLRVPTASQHEYDIAREWEIAAFSVAWLAFAGTLYAQIPAVGPLTVAAEIQPVHDSIGDAPRILSGHRAAGFGHPYLKSVPPDYSKATVTSHAELEASPADAAARVLGRWITSFEGRIEWDEFQVRS